MAAGALCFALILGIALWLLRLTAEAGLIDAAGRLDAGQKLTFSDAFRAGWSKIWQMIGLSLLLFGGVALLILIVTVLAGAIIGGTIAGAAAGGSGSDAAALFAALGAGMAALLCCLICGLALFAILVGVIHTFAQRAIVLENRGVIDSIKRAWQIIRANLGEVIILLILFLVLGLLVSAIIAAIFIPIGAISFGPGAARLFSGEPLSALDILLMVVGGLVLAVIVAAIRSFYTAFESAAYTLAFQEFTDKSLPDPVEKQPLP